MKLILLLLLSSNAFADSDVIRRTDGEEIIFPGGSRKWMISDRKASEERDKLIASQKQEIARLRKQLIQINDENKQLAAKKKTVIEKKEYVDKNRFILHAGYGPYDLNSEREEQNGVQVVTTELEYNYVGGLTYCRDFHDVVDHVVVCGTAVSNYTFLGGIGILW